MGKEEIERQIEELVARIQGVNAWIKEYKDNPETPWAKDPNANEMATLMMEFQRLASRCCQVIYIAGDKAYEAGEIPSRVASHEAFFRACDIFKGKPNAEGKFDKGLDALRNVMEEMLHLRGVDTRGFVGERDTTSNFFIENEDANNFFDEILYYIVTGSAIGDETLAGQANYDTIRDFFAKVQGVYLYIWQELGKNPEFQFDNAAEMNMILDNYQDLQERVAAFELFIPGFKQIEEMIKYIKEHYKFKDDLKDDENKKGGYGNGGGNA